MACKQIFVGHLPNPSNSGARYIGPSFGKFDWSTTLIAVPWQVGGTFKNAFFEVLTAPGASKSLTFTFVKNGSDTALVVTISGTATSGSNITDTVSVTAGDLLYWRCSPTSTPTVSHVRSTVAFFGTTTGESGYSGIIDLNSTQTWRGSMFMPGQWNTSNVDTNSFEIVAAAGDLKTLAYNLSAAPGGATSYQFAAYKNAVLQDGSGGTVDTRVTITGSATTGSWTGTLTLAAGDRVVVECVPSGTPTGATVGYAAKFLATTDGESQLCATVFVSLPTSGGPYYAEPHWNSTGWSSTEANHTTRGGPVNTVVLRSMRVRLTGTITTGPVTFALRINGANAGPSITMTSGNQTGSDLGNSATLAVSDLMCMSFTPTGSPGVARVAGLSFVMYGLATPAPIKAWIIGSKTTVSATRAVGIGLNDATFVHDESGKLALDGDLRVTGYMELADGMTAPAARSGRARFYVDVADGDLKIIFGDGTIKTIVTDT